MALPDSVNLNGDYATQLAQIQQRQKMAQMLQEQAAAPIEVQSYKGIQAPISNLSILAKALQGFGGAWQQQQLAKQQSDLAEAARQKVLGQANNFFAPVETPGSAATGASPPTLASAVAAKPMQDINAPINLPATGVTGGSAQTDYVPGQLNLGAPPTATSTVGAPVSPLGDTGQGKILPPATSRPKTPQEQQQIALALALSGLPGADKIGSELFNQAATKQTTQETLAQTKAALDARKASLRALPLPAGMSREQANSLIEADPEQYAQALKEFGVTQIKNAGKIPSVEQQSLAAYQATHPGATAYDFEVAKAKLGKSNVTVSVDTKGKGAYAENIGTGLAKSDLGMIDAARAAPALIQTSQRIKSALDSGNAITGIGAEPRLLIARAFGGQDAKVEETQGLLADMSKQTLSAIKTSNLGTGQGFSDKDLMFLGNAITGHINWDANSIRRLADLQEKAGRSSIVNGNAVMKKLRQSPDFAGSTALSEDVVAPGEYVPPNSVKPGARSLGAIFSSKPR
jgi:hypothetical protein